MFGIPLALLIAIRRLEEDTADPNDASALLYFGRRLRFLRLRSLHLLSSL